MGLEMTNELKRIGSLEVGGVMGAKVEEGSRRESETSTRAQAWRDRHSFIFFGDCILSGIEVRRTHRLAKFALRKRREGAEGIWPSLNRSSALSSLPLLLPLNFDPLFHLSFTSDLLSPTSTSYLKHPCTSSRRLALIKLSFLEFSSLVRESGFRSFLFHSPLLFPYLPPTSLSPLLVLCSQATCSAFVPLFITLPLLSFQPSKSFVLSFL